MNGYDTLDDGQSNDGFRYAALDGGALNADQIEFEMSKLAGWRGPTLLYVRQIERLETAAAAALGRWMQGRGVTCLAGCERADRLDAVLLEQFPWRFMGVDALDRPMSGEPPPVDRGTSPAADI